MVMVTLKEVKDSIEMWKRGFHEYFVRVDMTVPASTTLVLEFTPPIDQVWFKEDYKFKVDALDVIKMSYYSDGFPIFEDMLIGENELHLEKLKTFTVRNATIVIENTDTVDHTLSVLERYLIIPRREFEKILEEVEKEV